MKAVDAPNLSKQMSIAELYNFTPVVTLMRFGRWPEVLAEPAPDPMLTLDTAMKGMSVEQKMAALGDLFNIRSGRAARILTDITDFSGRYDTLFERAGVAWHT